MLLERAQLEFPRVKHLWLDAGYRGEDKGKDWVEKTLGWSVELLERAHKPASKRGVAGVGRGVGKRGREGRFGETVATRGLSGVAEEVGGGADIFLDGPEKEDEQGLREANRDKWGVHLRSDEPSVGEEIGPLVRLFGQFLQALGRIEASPIHRPLLTCLEARMPRGRNAEREGAC